MVKEKLDKIDKDGIGNLFDLPRLMETRNINRKKSEV